MMARTKFSGARKRKERQMRQQRIALRPKPFGKTNPFSTSQPPKESPTKPVTESEE
jgi:hypothetical protein